MTKTQVMELDAKGKVWITLADLYEDCVSDGVVFTALQLAKVPNDKSPCLLADSFVKGRYKPAPVMPETRKVPKEGWSHFMESDDFRVAMFKNGEPVLGIYLSSRGSMWQAGLYIHETKSYYYTSNFRKGYTKKWKRVGSSNIDATVAMEFLLGEPDRV